MTNPAGNNAYINHYPKGYINGGAIARASTTTLTLATVEASDSTNTSNISLTTGVTINMAVVGVNGIDTGAIAASSMYAVHVIGDSMGVKSTAGIISLSATAPSLPAGYDMFRLVGYWPSNGSSQLIVGYSMGSGNSRSFVYDGVVATAITAGAATSFTAIDLSNKVPAVDLTVARVFAALTPNAADDSASFVPSGGTGVTHAIHANVAAKIVDQTFMLPVKLISSLPKIDYKVSTASAALAVSIEGFDYYI